MPQGQATAADPTTVSMDNEAQARALDVIDDIVSQRDEGVDNFQQRQQPNGEDGTTPKRQPPRPRIDDKRNAIIARFRGVRSQPPAEPTQDIDSLARNGLPPEFEQYRDDGDSPDNAVQDAAVERVQDNAGDGDDQRRAPPAKQKVRLRINHQDVDMEMDDVIAHAQKSMAADNILDSAKSKARELDEIIAQARNRVARPDPASHHTGNEGSQSEPAQQDQGTDGGSHTSDDDALSRFVETVQFGDGKDAVPLLRDTINRAVDEAADRKVTVKMQQTRMNDEAARTDAILKQFNKDNPELLKDRSAQAVMKQHVFEAQVEDLAAIGVTMEGLQASIGHAPQPGDIAQAHQFYRSEGYKLKKPEVMLEDAHKHMRGWRGDATRKDPPTPPPADDRQQGRPAPRIAVNVDRDERRQQITPAPNRTSPPQQQRREAAPQRRPAGDVVARMRQQRDQARGRISA